MTSAHTGGFSIPALLRDPLVAFLVSVYELPGDCDLRSAVRSVSASTPRGRIESAAAAAGPAAVMASSEPTAGQLGV